MSGAGGTPGPENRLDPGRNATIFSISSHIYGTVGLTVRGGWSVPLAMTVSKFENFDPFLALKFEQS